MRLAHWHYPNLSKLSLWMGYCHAVLDKASEVSGKTEYHNHSAQEVRHVLEQKREIDDCWKAWFKAYNAVLTLLPHNRTEEQEPRASESRTEAQKAIELAEAICHFHSISAVPPSAPPQEYSNYMPPLAPQRNSFVPMNGEHARTGSPGTSKKSVIEPTRIVTGADISKYAHGLGERYPDWWKNEGKNHEVRKCNLFVDRVFRDLNVALPWNGKQIPTVRGMLMDLAHSSDWQSIYRGDMPFGEYTAQPGDFVLWDKVITNSNYDGSIW